MYNAAWRQTTYRFADLKELLAKATPPRSGDVLAGVAAKTAEENVAAKMALADVPLKRFLTELLIPYESDDVSRLIVDGHDARAFAPVAHMTVGEFRDWLLSEVATTEVLARLAPGGGLLAIDRLAFLALVGAWLLELSNGKRTIGRLGRSWGSPRWASSGSELPVNISAGWTEGSTSNRTNE